MAKYIRKHRRKVRFEVKCAVVLTVALLSLLFTRIVVGSINTSLTIDIQKMSTEVASLKTENQQLNIEIQTLQNKDRIYTMAADAGLVQNESNIVSISEGAMSEAE